MGGKIPFQGEGVRIIKVLDIEYCHKKIVANSKPLNEIDNVVRNEAQRILRLMDLLTEEYISEEILAVPIEEWEFEEELVALEEGTTPIARYILANEEKRCHYNHYYRQFRATPLPKPQEFV